MGTDIWVHVEYRDHRRRKYKHIDKDFYIRRSYLLFDILAGGRGRREPIYSQRGLPDDITRETYREFKGGEDDFHDMSWLTTLEYRRCLDRYHTIETATEEKSPSEERKWRQDYISSDNIMESDTVKDAEFIYQAMKASEDKGNSARIVFWFDN